MQDTSHRARGVRTLALAAAVLSLGAAAALTGCGNGSGDTPPDNVTATPTTVRIAAGSTAQITAQVTDGAGHAVNRIPTWTSSNTTVATVSSSGLVTAAAAGTTTVDGTIDGNHASVAVTVAVPAVVDVSGPTNVTTPTSVVPLQAAVLDAQSHALTASLSWQSSDTSVATIAADGKVTGVAPGVVTLTATTAGGAVAGALQFAVQSVPSGTIAFTSKRGASYGVPPVASGGVYLMDADGGNARLLVPDTISSCVQDQPSLGQCAFETTSPALSPDGLRVAVIANQRVQAESSAVAVIEICATGQAACIRVDYPAQPSAPGSATQVLSGVGAPTWSPQGTQLAFIGPDGKLWIWTLAGKTWTTADLGAGASSPKWSPDGQHIAYVTSDANGAAIWTVKPDGSGATKLSPAGSNDTAPAWSPDSLRIAFTRTTAGDADVWLMQADGSQAVNLSMNTAQDRNPSWSHAGDRIAFETNRDGNWEIYTMDTSGGSLTNLTQNAAADTTPDFRP